MSMKKPIQYARLIVKRICKTRQLPVRGFKSLLPTKKSVELGKKGLLGLDGFLSPYFALGLVLKLRLELLL